MQKVGVLNFDEHLSTKIKRAKDPSDILWTNVALKRKWRLIRIIIFSILLPGIVVFAVFQVFTTSINWQQFLRYENFPPDMDCDVVKQRLGGNIANMAYIEKQYRRLSKFPDFFALLVFLPQRISRTGATYCLC